MTDEPAPADDDDVDVDDMPLEPSDVPADAIPPDDDAP